MPELKGQGERKYVPIRCTVETRKAIKRGALERGTDIPTEIERLVLADALTAHMTVATTTEEGENHGSEILPPM